MHAPLANGLLAQDNGLSICRRTRSENTARITLLTKLGEEVDRIVGPEAGADDQITRGQRRSADAARRARTALLDPERPSDWRGHAGYPDLLEKTATCKS
jgi:PleD family two-component response regulator